mmetsp:Transcript_2813/g.7060  ORF Transcript_2813/g.7060 Transcript_2813/m.7060 type:complete len:107 (-) Transcript_2813:648-968(-)
MCNGEKIGKIMLTSVPVDIGSCCKLVLVASTHVCCMRKSRSCFLLKSLDASYQSWRFTQRCTFVANEEWSARAKHQQEHVNELQHQNEQKLRSKVFLAMLREAMVR